MKRQIEIEDNLDEIVESATEDVVDAFAHKDLNVEDFTDLYDMIDKLDYDGTFHEIIDSATPIYFGEINGLYYLYGSEADECFQNAGIGTVEDFDNYRQVALFFLIESRVLEDLKNWFEAEQDKLEEGDAFP